jgi:hypothetical protein
MLDQYTPTLLLLMQIIERDTRTAVAHHQPQTELHTSGSIAALHAATSVPTAAHQWTEHCLLWHSHVLSCAQQQSCYAWAEAAQHRLEAACAAAAVRIQQLPSAAVQAQLHCFNLTSCCCCCVHISSAGLAQASVGEAGCISIQGDPALYPDTWAGCTFHNGFKLNTLLRNQLLCCMKCIPTAEAFHKLDACSNGRA